MNPDDPALPDQDQDQFESLIQGVIDHQYGSCLDFIIPSTTAGLSAHMANLQALGKLKAAGMGQQSEVKQDQAIRGDTIHWIGDLSSNPFEQIYLNKIRKFILYLNQTCFTSIQSFESHYSHYAQGSFYKRHLDQFKNEKGRKFSIVLYLNENWQVEDGGMLSLYPVAGEQKQISPSAGKMVFFKSDEMEHEVLPSLTRERRSIAGWFKN